MRNLILNNIHYVETDENYTLESVAGKTTRIHNNGTESIEVTLPDATTESLSPTKIIDLFYDGTTTFNVTSSGEGGSGLSNYLTDDWTAETGWTLTEETTTPIDLDGTIKAVVANTTVADVGFYQDIIVSEKDSSSLLQLMFSFKNDANTDFTQIDFEVLDTDDSDEVLLEGNLLEYSTYNSVNEVYQFSAILGTSVNANYRVGIKTNSTLASEMSMFFSTFFLGQVSTFSVVDKGSKAGEIYYSAETPVDGLNSNGDLCFDDTETFTIDDYPDLNTSELDGKYIDVDGANFNMKNLSYDSGWVSNSDWTTRDITISHSLGIDLSELNIDFMVSSSADGADIVYRSGFSSRADTALGWNLVGEDDDSFHLLFGANGIACIRTGDQQTTILDTDAYYYKVVVSRKDAPQSDTYAYMRAKNVRSVELMAKQTNREDAGTIYIDYEEPVDGKNRMDDLVMDGATPFNLSDYPQINSIKDELDGVFITVTGSTFTTVDLTGKFLRQVISGGAVGDLQDDAFQGHLHIPTVNPSGGDKSFRLDYVDDPEDNASGSSVPETYFDGLASDGTNGTPRVADETRPTNIQVYYYLKTKSLSSIILGELTAQVARDDAGSMYYDYQSPTSGLNRIGDLAFDGTTSHLWTDYPNLLAIRTQLISADVFEDEDGTNFTLKAISPASGWNTVWEDSTPSETTVTLPVSDGKYRVIAGAPDTLTLTAFEITIDTSISGKTKMWSTSITNTTTLGAYYINVVYTPSTGLWSFYKGSGWVATFASIEKLEELGYAYMRTESLSTYIQQAMNEEAGYNGSVYRMPVQDISSANQQSSLDQFLNAGTYPKLDGWKVRVGWTGGDASFYHKIVSSLNLYNEFVNLPAGDGSSTYAWCGYGSGGLTLVKDEANSRWIVETDGCFDKGGVYGASAIGLWRQYTNKIILQRNISPSISGSELITVPVELADIDFIVSPVVNGSTPKTLSIVNNSVSTFTIYISATDDVRWKLEGEWRD